MVNIQAILSGLDQASSREIIYYLVRYFKQAHFLERGGKDFFADVFDRPPTDEIRGLTLRAISMIETEVGKSASEFDGETADNILDQLTDLEDKLQTGFSKEELGEASAFIRRI